MPYTFTEPDDPARDDDGLFGPGSGTWRIMSSPIMWVAALRALYLQALHPRVIRGTAAVAPNRTRTPSPAGSRRHAGALRARATAVSARAGANHAKASEPCERGQTKVFRPWARGSCRARRAGCVARLGGGSLRGF